MELSSGAPCALQEPNHEGESTSVTSQPLDIQATSKQEDSSSVMSLHLDIQATSKQEDSHSVMSLDMADDRGGMEASGTRAPRALGHFFFC